MLRAEELKRLLLEAGRGDRGDVVPRVAMLGNPYF
jgi:hypothetical protein